LLFVAACRGPSAPDAAVEASVATEASANTDASASADRVSPPDSAANEDATVGGDGAALVDGASIDDAGEDATMDGAVVILEDASADARDAGSVRAEAGPYVRPGTIDVPPLPPVDTRGLARDDAGNILGAQTEQGSVVLVSGDAGPIHVLARCAAIVSHCVSPGVRTLDQCMISAPVCRTATPWAEPACCPMTCLDAYEARRRAGDAPLRSFDRALFSEPSCVAGLAAGGM
jgi:hypothetical protein